MASKIDWLDGGEVWNPLAGCSPVSPGCANCYSARLVATRLKHLPDFKGLAYMSNPGGVHNAPRWMGQVRLLPHKLEQPLRWRKPRRIFVCDKGDLFHEKVPSEYIAAVFGVMAACPQHTFVVLTKRAQRMVKWFRWLDSDERLDSNGHPVSWYPFAIEMAKHGLGCTEDVRQAVASHPKSTARGQRWPLPNVWLGVTAEDQPRADERISLLLQVPAAVRLVSYEPGLGALDFSGERIEWLLPFKDTDPLLQRTPRIDWVVIGCESGPKARPFDPDWADSVVEQCAAAGVPCFTKQLPEHRDGTGRLRKSAELAKQGWPVQYPEAR